MQYIALNVATIIPGDRETRLVSNARFSYGTEEAHPACILHTRLYYPPRAGQGDSLSFDSTEEDWGDGESTSGMSGWRRLITWAGAALAGWAVVIGLVAIARAIF